MIKKTNHKKIRIIIVSLFIIFFATNAFAACISEKDGNGNITVKGTNGEVCYTPLQDAFTSFSTAQSSNDLAGFLEQVFNFGIAAAVVLALVMIIWGGIEYMTTDAWFNKQDAIKKIQDALIGLGLALVSYLILYTINPCLVIFKPADKCGVQNTFLYPITQQK